MQNSGDEGQFLDWEMRSKQVGLDLLEEAPEICLGLKELDLAERVEG